MGGVPARPAYPKGGLEVAPSPPTPLPDGCWEARKETPCAKDKPRALTSWALQKWARVRQCGVPGMKSEAASRWAPSGEEMTGSVSEPHKQA